MIGFIEKLKSWNKQRKLRKIIAMRRYDELMKEWY